MNPYTPTLATLFEGHKEAYGKFRFSEQLRADGKIKGTGTTVRGSVSPDLWDSHLEGKDQLGIIPINADNMAKFGAIDIDDYHLDRKDINDKIIKHNLPVVHFRSKSGGAHLFLFVTEFVPASLMQNRLKEIAAFMGYGTAEIFPKQTQILKERGDIGQWINMPYFSEHSTDRHAWNPHEGIALTLPEFLIYVESQRITPEQLKNLDLTTHSEIKDGPPCLQLLVRNGFGEGVRNNGLYNLGVYAQKAYPDGWKQKVEEFNTSYLKPPLPPKEVLTIIASLDKKDYNYSCKKQPICNHCNAALCRTRKYGIGDSNSAMPVFGSLSKLESDPPIWFLDIEAGGRLELTTEDIQNPLKFQKRCLDSLNIMPPLPKREAWQTIISELLTNVTVIPVPKEATPAGQLMHHVETFCNMRKGNEEAECLIRGLVWDNDGHHNFRMTDLVEYLERKRFYDYKSNKIASILRDNKAKHTTVRLKNTNINVYAIPFFLSSIEAYQKVIKENEIPFQ
jgi:hypothetical protein